MLAFPKLLAALGTVFLLMSAVVCPLPEVQPHHAMEVIMDARLLWEGVQRNVFPGMRHTPNLQFGVSDRWLQFLREHGNDALENAISDMKEHTITFDNRNYVGAIKIFRNFFRPSDRRTMLLVSKPGEQFLARRMVNAFAGYLFQHAEAEREMELEAALARDGEGSSDSGPGQVLEAEPGTSKRRRTSRQGPSPREGTGQSW